MRPEGFKHSAGCAHRSTISATSAGLERIVCEDCGHMSFRYESVTSSGVVDRDKFARRREDRILKALISLNIDTVVDRFPWIEGRHRADSTRGEPAL